MLSYLWTLAVAVPAAVATATAFWSDYDRRARRLNRERFKAWLEGVERSPEGLQRELVHVVRFVADPMYKGPWGRP